MANYELTDESFKFQKGNRGQQGRKIINCQFKKIILTNFQLTTLQFFDCKIERLEFDNVQFNLIQFTQCQIGELAVNSNSASIDKISIENETAISSLVANFRFNEFQILKSKIDHLKITSKNLASISIDCRGNTKQFQTTKFEGNFRSLALNDIEVEEVELSELTGSSSISLSSSTVNQFKAKSDINLFSASSSEIKCLDCIGINDLHLVDFRSEKIIYKKGENLSISASNDTGPRSRSKVRTLNLTELGNLRNLTVADCDFEDLLMNGLRLLSCSLNSVSISKRLQIERVSISEGLFSNLDLEKAEIHFLNSTLTGSQITNVRWPKGYEFYEYLTDRNLKTIKEKLDILWALKESYRQLKVLSLSQYNKIDALYFQKQELKIFWLITKLKVRHESFFQNIGNWFILGTNKLFSDFGQNIWRPLFFLLISHLIWFALLLAFRFEIYPTLKNTDLEITRAAINAFFVTILPTHSFNVSIGSYKDVYIGGFIDFLMRIFSSYFIFYFVYSSRKFHQ